MSQRILMALLAVLLTAFTTEAVMAQGKVIDSETKTEQKLKAKQRAPSPVLFENERVRVVEARTKPGERNAMQERPDRVIYHFNEGKQRIHYSDGKTQEREFKKDSVEFRKQDNTASENVGKSETRNLVIFLK